MYRMLIRESLLLGLVAPRNPFFLVHSGGVRTHLRGLQVTVTRMAGKLTVPDDIQGWMYTHRVGIIIPVLGGGDHSQEPKRGSPMSH